MFMQPTYRASCKTRFVKFDRIVFKLATSDLTARFHDEIPDNIWQSMWAKK